MLKVIPKDYHDTTKGTLKLLWEEEWRALGITQVGGLDTMFWAAAGTQMLINHAIRAWAGSTTKFTNPNPTSYCSSE